MTNLEAVALKLTVVLARATGAFSRRLGGFFAAHLWFTPWHVPLSERALAKQAAWLEQTRPVKFSVDGLNIAGFAAGQGPTILLVHGWGERGASLGAFIEPLVRAGYRVVGIDLPGHGSTSRGKTNPLEGSSALRGVSDHLGGIHAVIAHSMGGYATTIALGEGLSPEKVVMLAPASNVHAAIPKFAYMFGLPPKAVAGLRATIERRFGSDIWTRLDGEAIASRLRMPALIVHDRDDDQVDLADSARLAAAWESSRMVVTQGLGHGKLVRDPAVIDDVCRFLDGGGRAVVHLREAETLREVSAAG